MEFYIQPPTAQSPPALQSFTFLARQGTDARAKFGELSAGARRSKRELIHKMVQKWGRGESGFGSKSSELHLLYLRPTWKLKRFQHIPVALSPKSVEVVVKCPPSSKIKME